MMDAHGLACFHDLLVGHSLLAIDDVLLHGPLENPCVLEDHAEQVVDVAAPHFFDRHAVYQDVSAIGIVKPHQEIDHGRLTGTGGPDDGYLLTGLYFRRESVDDLPAGNVAEVHVPEFHVAFDLLELARADDLFGQLLFLDELEHPFARGRDGLHPREGLGHLGQGLGEQTHVDHEGDDDAYGYLPVDDHRRTDDAHRHVSEVAYEVHQGHHEARQELGHERAAGQLLVYGVELLRGLFLPVVHFDHVMRRIYLRDVPVHVAEVLLLDAEILLRVPHDQYHHPEAGDT